MSDVQNASLRIILHLLLFNYSGIFIVTEEKELLTTTYMYSPPKNKENHEKIIASQPNTP